VHRAGLGISFRVARQARAGLPSVTFWEAPPVGPGPSPGQDCGLGFAYGEVGGLLASFCCGVDVAVASAAIFFFLGGAAFIAGHLWHVISTEASNSTRMQQATHGSVNEESTAMQANIPYAAMNKNKRRR
jgi:hypothetical protein